MEELSFGEWLKRRRRALDLTQEQLAHQISCSTSALRKIEAEERRPSEQIVAQLAEVFKIPSHERATFLKFARGNLDVAPIGVIESAPWRVSSSLSLRSNLPTFLTSFIGREKEQAEILKLIDKHRLVALVGSGGVGKTRLSLKVGEQMLGDFAHGVWLVELAPILDSVLVPRTTAIAIGLRDEPQRPVIDMLTDYLREKQMLIILDNCEHLLDVCAQVADTLLKRCPRLKILATSREALGILGEAIYRVPSLQLPDLGELLGKFREYESVRLFEERAQLTQMNFSLTIENISSVAKICNRLDGIPLAIELAAARVNMYSTEQIAARLQQSFHLLTTGNRAALPRHQTLQAAIDWSYNLLSPNEQILFRRLSVFVNGWTLEAAESICSDATIKSEDVLNLLSHLVEKSLINIEELRSARRYGILETIRQYADEKLMESGEYDSVRDKHMEYFLNLAETAEPHLRRAEQIEWLHQLDAEHDNLRAALAWAMGKPSAEPILRLAGALGTFWYLHGHWLEGANWLDQALSKGWDQNNYTEKAARARTLYRRANLALQLEEGDDWSFRTFFESTLILCQELEDQWGIAYSQALIAQCLKIREESKVITIKPLFEQALNEFQALGDVWGEARVLRWLVELIAVANTGNREEYLEISRSAIACARASRDRDRIADILVEVSGYFFINNQLDKAEKMLQEAEQLYTELGASYGINLMRWPLALLSFARGNYEKAKVEANRYIEYMNRIGERTVQSRSEAMWALLALIAEAEDNLKAAVECIQKGLEICRGIGELIGLARCLILQARFEYQCGNSEIAIQSAHESLDLTRKGNFLSWHTTFVLCHVGGLLVERKTETAVQILALSESLAQTRAVPRDLVYDKLYFDRFLSKARRKLTKTEFMSAWEAGFHMTLDQAINLALIATEEL